MTGPSPAELVARLRAAMQRHGGEVLAYTTDRGGAWVLTRTAAGRPTVSRLSSRPRGRDIELVVVCEPFPPAADAPLALVEAAWHIEPDPAQVEPGIRAWRRDVSRRRL